MVAGERPNTPAVQRFADNDQPSQQAAAMAFGSGYHGRGRRGAGYDLRDLSLQGRQHLLGAGRGMQLSEAELEGSPEKPGRRRGRQKRRRVNLTSSSLVPPTPEPSTTTQP